MYFVGLDVHLRHTSICILNAIGVAHPGSWLYMGAYNI